MPVTAAYDSCSATTYAPANTTLNLVGLVSATETDSVACAGFTQGSPASVPDALNTLSAPATVSRPDQVVSASRTFYDVTTFDPTFPQTLTPTLGDVTLTQSANGASGGTLTWLSTAKNVYDSRGRITTATDAAGHATSTTYTDSTYGLATAVKVTNAKSQATSSTLDPQRGLALSVTDPNGIVTTSQYDELARVTAVWLAGRPPASSPANYTYSYTLSNTGVSSATTNRLNSSGEYSVSTLLYDSMLRPRQTQTLTPQGTGTGRMIVDTIYDSHGWVHISNNGWYDSSSTPNTTIVTAAALGAQVPNSDLYTYGGRRPGPSDDGGLEEFAESLPSFSTSACTCAVSSPTCTSSASIRASRASSSASRATSSPSSSSRDSSSGPGTRKFKHDHAPGQTLRPQADRRP